MAAANNNSSFAASWTTGRSLILLQLLTRVLTFALNQALVRLAAPEAFGTAAIQFDLLAGSILFLSREGIRNALRRARNAPVHELDSSAEKEKRVAASYAEDTKRRQADVLATVPFYLGVAVSAVLTAFYLYTLPATTSAQNDFYASLALYVLSSLLELLIEPLYIRTLSLASPNMRTRLQAEGGMAIVKAVVTVGAVVGLDKLSGSAGVAELAGRASGERALLAFALGQIAGTIWLAGRYIAEYGLDGVGWVSVPSQ